MKHFIKIFVLGIIFMSSAVYAKGNKNETVIYNVGDAIITGYIVGDDSTYVTVITEDKIYKDAYCTFEWCDKFAIRETTQAYNVKLSRQYDKQDKRWYWHVDSFTVAEE